MTDVDAELARFERGAIDVAGFDHGSHVRIGFELARRHPFTEAAFRFSTGLRAMAAHAGRPALYHDTITVAFLALIAERHAGAAYRDFDAFARDNQDLLRKDALLDWYEPARLMSPLARATFVLPWAAGDR
ncbi:MAG: hypothetical protein ACJ8GK_01315 [Luteimonas sp.]